MNKRKCLALALCALIPGLTAGADAAAPAHPRPPSARSVTGEYNARKFRGRDTGYLEVQELSGGRIKFELIALGQVLSPGGPTISAAAGVIPLSRRVAVYQRRDGSLTLRFTGHRVLVTEQGDMGFALGASPGGAYARHSRVPAFDSLYQEGLDTDADR